MRDWVYVPGRRSAQEEIQRMKEQIAQHLRDYEQGARRCPECLGRPDDQGGCDLCSHTGTVSAQTLSLWKQEQEQSDEEEP